MRRAWHSRTKPCIQPNWLTLVSRHACLELRHCHAPRTGLHLLHSPWNGQEGHQLLPNNYEIKLIFALFSQSINFRLKNEFNGSGLISIWLKVKRTLPTVQLMWLYLQHLIKPLLYSVSSVTDITKLLSFVSLRSIYPENRFSNPSQVFTFSLFHIITKFCLARHRAFKMSPVDWVRTSHSSTAREEVLKAFIHKMFNYRNKESLHWFCSNKITKWHS